MRTAQTAESILADELMHLNIFTFKWPTDMDSGIDLVGFAVLSHQKGEEEPGATAFVAGFQSKGTEDYFTVANSRSVRIDQHEDYWKSAGLPVFVVNVSADRAAVLIEDARSFLIQNDGDLKSITTTVPIRVAAADIRLRMFAHALAPWLSARLRMRTLAHRHHVLNVDSVWSLLNYSSGIHSAFPVPGSFVELEQYFTLLAFVYEDSNFRRKLHEDLKPVEARSAEDRSKDNSSGSYRLMGGMIDAFLKFAELYGSFPPPPVPKRWLEREQDNVVSKSQDPSGLYKTTYALARIEDSINVIDRIWAGSAQALNMTSAQLAKATIQFGRSFRVPAQNILGAIAAGECSVRGALTSSLLGWASSNGIGMQTLMSGQQLNIELAHPRVEHWHLHSVTDWVARH